MDIRQLKLELINRISRCEDEAVLRAVANVLSIGEGRGMEAPPPGALPFHASTEGTTPLSGDAADLQQDMDEVFG